MADDKTSRKDLERQSSSDSFQSTGESERQTANWIEVRIIGSGGFGNVTLWKNKHDGAHLVIKECRIPTHMLRGMEDRWHNEINLLSKLTHPNITTARQAEEREFGRALSFPFLCMEYCEGGDLRQVLRNPDNCCGLHETQIREVCHDIADGIIYLHKSKIVHRDLKPENILLKEYNGKVVYKLTDFGYAKQYDQSSMCTSFVGTMQYVAPEILQNQSYNKDVDFWSFGIVVFECITGRRPFLPGDSPMQWLVKVEKKRPDHIAVDWAENDVGICYHDTIPPPHQLSRVFEDGITKWLRIMLRWQPQQRGGAEVSEGEREWYVRLQEILVTKMIHVVCMSTGNVYTYPIDEADTNSSHIIQGIKEDTGLDYDQQKLLTSDGCLVTRATNPISRATMASCDVNNSFYLFTDSQLTSIRLVGKETKQITKLITNPDESMSIPERRRCYGVMYSLMRERAHMFTLLLSGYQAMITHLQKLSDKQHQYINDVRTTHTKLQAKLEFLKQIQQGDQESLRRLHDSESISQTTARRVLSSWKQSESNIVSIGQNLIQLLSNIDKHSDEYSSIKFLVDEFILLNKRISTLLDKFKTNFVSVAKEQFEKIKYIDRREELPSKNVAEAQKLLMHSVQCCDQLIEQFNNSDIAHTMMTMSRLNKEPKKLEDQLRNHDVQINSLQERRQADVWQLIEQKASTPPPNETEQSPSNNVVVSTSVENSLKTFKRQVSLETNDSILSMNNDLLRKLEILSKRQHGVADSLQLH